MSNSYIFNLNQYCLFAIFEQIKKNCEYDRNDIPDIIRYRDLILFAISDDRIHSLFHCWNQKLYIRLDVEKIHLWTCRFVIVKFYELHVSQMKCTSAEKKTFWDIFFTLIEENTTVTSCILHYMPYDMYCPDHIEIFEKTMKIFSEKKSLSNVTLQMINYSPEHLEQFHNLKSLSLFVPMRANELIECVKSNPKLTNLEFTSPHIYGRLADIAPYCGNLESLTIHMKPETDASEYSPLAKLPKLKIFDIFGYPREGSLNALFRSMALNDTVLQYISIRQAKLGAAEVEELSKVHLPNISALDLGMEPLSHNNLYYNSIHIMSNMGHIALSIHRKSDQDVLLRLHDWHNMLQGGTNPLWFEKQNLLQQIQMRNNSECGKKVASLLLLQALHSQLPSITQNIHRLTEIGGLKELEVKIKLNIEEELRKFVDSSDFVSFEDLEGDIAIDADVQNIIILVQLTYLKDILKISKYTNIKNSLAIQNYEFELDFDIRL